MKSSDDNLSNTNLATVCSLTDAVEAELVKNTLVDHHIDCQIAGEHQAGFTGTLEIDILVREADVDKAKEFLRIHHPKLFGTG